MIVMKKEEKQMLDQFSLVHTILAYVEAHLDRDITPAELESTMRVSYSYLREIFKRDTGISLARYILRRRIANAAFDLVHTNRSVLDVSMCLGFDNPDSFTRSFRRVTGQNPSAFRIAGIRVGRTRLATGIFGPSILPFSQSDYNQMEERIMKKETIKDMNSCILYGVRKVNYCYEECTPFPSSLRSVLNYLGQDIDYCYLMAASGASFRLRWNREFWDGGNVDIGAIYEDPIKAFVRSFEAAGRSFCMLPREGSTKEDFITFIKKEIDEGRPVIALGIIGPPEACIVTGYRNDGQTLLGWNFFQEMGEFAGMHTIDPSGYFVTDAWWENECTTLLMAVGEKESKQETPEQILRNALWVLRTETVGVYAGGQAAYDCWAKKLSDDHEFNENLPMPQFFDRLMCMNDALTMTTEGRAYAGYYLSYVASVFKKEGHDDKAALAERASERFMKEFETAQGIGTIFQGGNEEETIRAMFAKSNREKAVSIIREIARLDKEAADAIERILS